MQNIVPLAGRREQFHLRHGADCVNIEGMIYYSNGATCDQDRLGVMREPPEDQFERAKLVVKYHDELLRRALQEFREREFQLRGAAGAAMRTGYPAPSKAEVETLGQLQTVVRKRQTKLLEARERLQNVMPEWMKGKTTSDAYNKSKCQEVLAMLDSIKI